MSDKVKDIKKKILEYTKEYLEISSRIRDTKGMPESVSKWNNDAALMGELQRSIKDLKLQLPSKELADIKIKENLIADQKALEKSKAGIAATNKKFYNKRKLADAAKKITGKAGIIGAVAGLAMSKDAQAAADDFMGVEVMGDGELPKDEQKKKEQYNKQRKTGMPIYNHLKDRDMETIEGYIKMLDKKGDREGLKQALKAKSEAGKRQGDYQQAKKLESEAQKTFEKYKPRKPQSEDSKSKANFNPKEEADKFKSPLGWKEATTVSDKVIEGYRGAVNAVAGEKAGKYLGGNLRTFKELKEMERKPQSDDSLKDKVLREYDKAKYPDIMESKTDPRIKRAELSEESKVKSLSDYTSGKVDTSDDKKEMDEDEIKEFIRKSRKRTGQ